MPAIDPEAFYTIEASYPEGAFVGRTEHVLGKNIDREKRSLKTLAEEGYRITYHVTREENQ